MEKKLFNFLIWNLKVGPVSETNYPLLLFFSAKDSLKWKDLVNDWLSKTSIAGIAKIEFPYI